MARASDTRGNQSTSHLGLPPGLLKEERHVRWNQGQLLNPATNASLNELPENPRETGGVLPPPTSPNDHLSEPFNQPGNLDDMHRRNIEQHGSDLHRRFEEAAFTRSLPNLAPFPIRPRMAAGALPTLFSMPAQLPKDTPLERAFNSYVDRGPTGPSPTELPGDVPPAFQLPTGPSRGRTPNATKKPPSSTAATVGSSTLRVPPKSAASKDGPAPVIVAVFGMTGAGKSTFVGKVSGRAVTVGHSQHSCTSEVEEVECTIRGMPVKLVDTPGFDDTERSDTEVLQLIASYLQDVYDKAKLAGVIYLHKITENRLGGSALKNLRMLRELCGAENLANVTLTTTMWGELKNPTVGDEREAELMGDNTFWGQMRARGATVARYDNTKKNGTELVSKLIARNPVVLQIQRELNIKKLKLIQTDAGRIVSDKLSEDEKKAAKEGANLKKLQRQATMESKSASPPRPFLRLTLTCDAQITC